MQLQFISLLLLPPYILLILVVVVLSTLVLLLLLVRCPGLSLETDISACRDLGTGTGVGAAIGGAILVRFVCNAMEQPQQGCSNVPWM